MAEVKTKFKITVDEVRITYPEEPKASYPATQTICVLSLMVDELNLSKFLAWLAESTTNGE